mmetsp:Transcript_102479/g.320306  ORF Transcript_102479/g.320306 Transcript_102479/m.320306 type:complete len:221 (-) Transcript_102479:38-700(-)
MRIPLASLSSWIPLLLPVPSAIAVQVCQNSKVETLDIYRYHTANDASSLANRNVGDAIGDMHYVCTRYDAKTYKTGFISHWRVAVNTSWGPYAVCNTLLGSNRCFGGGGGHVGRENAVHRAGKGQCNANQGDGSWYSFPEEGACGHGDVVGANGCTWGEARRVRTIAADCVLEERGLAKACDDVCGHGPYEQAAAILEAALASADPARGGCPEAGSRQAG